MPSAMKLPREMPPSQFAVRVGPQELGHIVGLRRNLEHAGALAEWAERYLKLGWPLVALEAATGGRLQVDFSRPRQIWRKALMDASLQGRKVSLAVRLGAFSRLFVLRVETCRGRLRLDRLGDWRSPWVAAAGAREQHFYLKPLTWRLSGFQDPDIALLGETRPALVPPSRDVGSRHPWRWLQAPWETPPPLPPP
ncbi:MAG: hypothetical protein JRI59_02220, partial [Deltaproteobacteria bacterium]|nr:hypothetical protein [Deltaproteobacteria bacterium]